MFYSKVLIDNINNEKQGISYVYSKEDGLILYKMLNEINNLLGTHYQYLAEIDAFDVHGAGLIMSKYFDAFSSESVRAYLIPQLVSDKIEKCDKRILNAYMQFKNSDEYISPPGKPAPTQIYVRYDNAFKKLKPKGIKNDLISLLSYPRDAFYLPFTTRMLASWKPVGFDMVLSKYLNSSNITAESVGLPEESAAYNPSLTHMKKELQLTAIDGLRHYPVDSTKRLLQRYAGDLDKDICIAAKKALEYCNR